MPPGFGLVDAALVSLPVFLLLLGLIRGAPVELASCLGCVAGGTAAWIVSRLPLVHALGQPATSLVAMATAVGIWQMARLMSRRYGFDTRWIDLGGLFDSIIGGVMGGTRGVAFAAAACLAYSILAAPLGWAVPSQTFAYPLFLAAGTAVADAVTGTAEPVADHPAVTRLAAAPPLPMPGTNGPALATLIQVIAPSAAAAPLPPLMQPHDPRSDPRSDLRIRSVPAGLEAARHLLLHPPTPFRHPPHR